MKKLLTLMMIGVVTFTLVGCGNDEKNEKTTEKKDNTVEKDNSVNLSNVQKKIEELGVKLEKTQTAYDMVGANDGFKLTSDDYRIEIYKFDKASEAYKTAETKQALTLDGFGDMNATVKNGYAYILDDEFPQHDAVKNIWDQLK